MSRMAVAKGARGFTLVELMVSLLVGLVVLVAMVNAYVGSSRAARAAEGYAQMSDDAATAFSILTSQLRMAGNNPLRPQRLSTNLRNPVYAPSTLTTTFALTSFAVRACDGGFTDTASAASVDALTCPAAGTGPDAIALTYEADPFSTVPPEGASTATDCLGYELPSYTAKLTTIVGTTSATVESDVNYQVADNRFYIATPAGQATPGLMCRGNGTASQPAMLVENVEDLQLRFGTIPASATSTVGSIAGYLTAAELSTQADLAALPSDADRWSKVVSVRICLLMRSATALADDAASARYVGCDGTVVTNPPDLRLRKAFWTTVVLRKRT